MYKYIFNVEFYTIFMFMLFDTCTASVSKYGTYKSKPHHDETKH